LGVYEHPSMPIVAAVPREIKGPRIRHPNIREELKKKATW